MKHRFLFLLIVFAGLFQSGCANGGGGGNFSLDANAFAEKINENGKAPVLDVRTPEEFQSGHLQKALNIDWNASGFDQKISNLKKEEPVFVYCLSGARSHAAAESMRAAGFTQVYELQGGIMKWRAANLPEENVNAGGMSSADYEKLLQTDKKVLIDFYAKWCGPCKKMGPYLEEMKTTMADSVIVVRIDADQNQALVKSLGVDALPTLFLYKDKKVVWSYNGFISKDDLLKELAK
ncbi:MAG: thioredoxin domain-containing protein [Chitinophagales bacterium]